VSGNEQKDGQMKIVMLTSKQVILQ